MIRGSDRTTDDVEMPCLLSLSEAERTRILHAVDQSMAASLKTEEGKREMDGILAGIRSLSPITDEMVWRLHL